MITHSESAFTNEVVTDGRLETVLGRYKPSWFYATPTIGSILSVLQPLVRHKPLVVEYQSH